jgi:hypothetical protein
VEKTLGISRKERERGKAIIFEIIWKCLYSSDRTPYRIVVAGPSSAREENYVGFLAELLRAELKRVPCWMGLKWKRLNRETFRINGRKVALRKWGRHKPEKPPLMVFDDVN